MNNHLIADHGSIRPFSAWLGEVGDPDMCAALRDDNLGDVLLTMHHDEDAEVYLNGVLAAKVNGYISNYEEFALTKEGRAALKKGKNVLAVHCHQTTGGQYIDVGLLELKRQSR